MSDEKWLQKDGTEIQLKKMSTSHINNCIKMINKGACEY